MRSRWPTSSCGASWRAAGRWGAPRWSASEKLAAGEGDAHFLHAKIATARFYADCILPQTSGLEHTITHGAESALALEAEAF